MTTDIWFWLGLFALALVITLEVYDRMVKPLPLWRKIRWPVAGALATVWAILTFRKTEKPGRTPPKVEPEEFDDAPERETDRQADDLDLQGSEADRIIDELERAAAERDRELKELRSRSE